MKLEPLGPNMVVKVTEQGERRHGSIIIPNVAHQQHLIGRVYAVGPDVVDIEEGDVIIFDRYYGSREVVLENESWHIVRDEAVLARVREDDEEG